jgi:hypothetical protein
MATATLITVPVYQINSTNVINRSLYPYGMGVAFAGASILVQPNTGTELNDLQAGGQAGGALIYSKITSAATGETVFFSSLTVAAIVTLANA